MLTVELVDSKCGGQQVWATCLCRWLYVV